MITVLLLLLLVVVLVVGQEQQQQETMMMVVMDVRWLSFPVSVTHTYNMRAGDKTIDDNHRDERRETTSRSNRPKSSLLTPSSPEVRVPPSLAKAGVSSDDVALLLLGSLTTAAQAG